MKKGLGAFLIGGCLIGAGCADHNHFAMRPLPAPGETADTGKALLAHARSELALGNVGLALESFQRLLREQPNDPQIYQGIAACYAAMGRYDLTRTNLEFALAYSPNDPRLLNEYSAALEGLGERAQAVQVRAEIERLQVAAATKTVPVQRDLTPIGVARVGSVTVKLPELSQQGGPKDNGSSPAVPHQLANLAGMHIRSSKTTGVQASELPPAQSRVQVAGPVPAAKPQSSATKTATASVGVRKSSHSAPVSTPHSGLQVEKLDAALAPTLKRTPLETATTGIVQLTASNHDLEPILTRRFHGPSPQEIVVEPRHRASANSDMRRDDAPHLERISPSEVALFTGSSKRKSSNINVTEANARSNAVSSVPVKPFSSRPRSEQTLALVSLRWVPLTRSTAENVQLLNAARRQGLAADVRTTLLNRGWPKIGIGNATMVRAHTVVLYGKSRSQLAYRLASQFRCKAQKVAGLKKVIVLLGRDASRRQSWSERA